MTIFIDDNDSSILVSIWSIRSQKVIRSKIDLIRFYVGWIEPVTNLELAKRILESE